MTVKPIAEPRLRIEEAAAYANVGISYIRKLIKTRRLKAIRSERGRYLIKRQDVGNRKKSSDALRIAFCGHVTRSAKNDFEKMSTDRRKRCRCPL